MRSPEPLPRALPHLTALTALKWPIAASVWWIFIRSTSGVASGRFKFSELPQCPALGCFLYTVLSWQVTVLGRTSAWVRCPFSELQPGPRAGNRHKGRNAMSRVIVEINSGN